MIEEKADRPTVLLVVAQNGLFRLYAAKKVVDVFDRGLAVVVVLLLLVNSSSPFFPYVERFHHLLCLSLLPSVVIGSVSVTESDDSGDDADDDDDVFFL